jgi:3'-phosphoadenosine 5'-phosphosulfate sulfotransferase (PAPS reductase)/FAD synthetase
VSAQKAAVELIRRSRDEAPGIIVLAYSGGKDALAVAFLLREAGVPFVGICETSFYFAKATADIKRTATEFEDIRFFDSLDDDWLRRHPEFIFTDDGKLKAQTYLARQQTTVRRKARELGASIILWGRRNQENTVIAPVRRDKTGVLHVFPIREWRHEAVWELIDGNIPARPWIYGTHFGYIRGNAPFYSLSRRYMGGSVAECWRYCNLLDPAITEERFKP